MYINLDSYRVFYYVARYRSFTKAAEMLYSNQPNVTRSIKNLEQALGCTLFIRSSRSVQLTPEGEELLSHIAPAIQQIQAGEESVLLHSSMQSGTIRIGASELALHHILLPALETFRQEYPGIRLRIFNSNSPQAVSALKEGLVDLSLVTLPVELSDNFVQTDLAKFREIPVCGNAYAAAAAHTLTLQELTFYPLISLWKSSSSHQLYENWFRGHGCVFSPDIEAATSDQILPLIRANLGIGFLPEHTAEKAAAQGNVHILHLAEAAPERSICLLKRKDIPLSLAAEKLETLLLERAAHAKEALI